MRVLIDIGHPAHIHFFKNLISNLNNDGHDVKITARDKEVSLALLESYGLPYELRGELYRGMLNKAFGMLKIDLKLLSIAKKFNPDILLGIHNPYIAHVSAILGKPGIIFTDTENVKIASLLTFPFARTIITPDFFRDRIDPKKHVTIHGFKEIAYLHPYYFTADPHVLEHAGVSVNERLIVLRFISWDASHDTGLKGISPNEQVTFVRELSEYGRVMITSEKPLPSELEKYRVRIPPEQMHSLLFYANLYIGEGGTMATEAAILGTPSIHIESTGSGSASGEMSGNFRELRDKYGLLYFFAFARDALPVAKAILEDEQSKPTWKKRRDRLLNEVIDVTTWLTDFVEQYPKNGTGIHIMHQSGS